MFLDPQKAPKSLAAVGLRPRPHWGSLQRAPPDPLAGLRGPTSKGPTSKGKGGRGGEGILLRNSFRGLVTPLLILLPVAKWMPGKILAHFSS